MSPFLSPQLRTPAPVAAVVRALLEVAADARGMTSLPKPTRAAPRRPRRAYAAVARAYAAEAGIRGIAVASREARCMLSYAAQRDILLAVQA